jgi:hypothetical protein
MERRDSRGRNFPSVGLRVHIFPPDIATKPLPVFPLSFTDFLVHTWAKAFCTPGSSGFPTCTCKPDRLVFWRRGGGDNTMPPDLILSSKGICYNTYVSCLHVTVCLGEGGAGVRGRGKRK